MGIAVLLAASVGARAAPVPEEPISRLSALQAFEARLELAAQSEDFVGLAVVVVDRGKITLKRTYGTVDTAATRPVDSQTLFRLASLSKGFAATLAGVLAQEGKLDLSAPLSAYPIELELPRQGEKVATVENLLSHRLGLPPNAYDNLLEADRPVPVILHRLGEVKPICRIGTCYGYQNVAFNSIADIITRLEGRSFDQAIRDRLFAPLAMTRAQVGNINETPDENWARPHVLGRGGWYERPVAPAYARVPAAGGVNASIDDMAQWLSAQLGHAPDVLPAPVLELVHTPRVKTRQELRKQRWRRARLKDAHYGLGWRIFDYAGERLVFHAGGVEGYRAQIAMLPDHDLGLVVLWNSEGRRGWNLLPTFLDSFMGLDDPDWLDLEELVADQGLPNIQTSSGNP